MLIFIHYIFLIYTLMILIRLIASWFPAARHQGWLHWLATYTDPYLMIFRRIIPPIGGVLDLSPLLAFLGLRLLENFIYYLLK